MMVAEYKFNNLFVKHDPVGFGLCDLPGGIRVSGKIVIDDISIDNDGIGSYEYWGAKCYDHGTDYVADFTVVSLELEDCDETEVDRERLESALIDDYGFQEAIKEQLKN